MSAKHTFLPWARSGASADIQTVDETQAVTNRATLTVKLELDAGEQVLKNVALFGPGDVKALDVRQIVRVEPHPDTLDFPPEQFPLVEFGRIDLPWLFTPARSTATDTLRPWLVLAVVERAAILELTSGAEGLPRLKLGDAKELPPLADAAAWAHVHIAGELAGQTAWQIAAAESGRVVARLLGARRLRGETEYLAALVPAFKAGVLAGLGQPVAAAAQLEPAWTPQSTALELPVYFHWRFRTAPSGDFASLAKRLKPVPAAELDPAVGRRDIDASDPGLGLTVAPRRLGLGGALRAVQAGGTTWDPTDRMAFRKALAGILNAPASAPQGSARPTAPPIYARWHAAASTVDASSEAWLAQLNLDPRHRATAALGTAVVQRLEEDLMAAAWRQIGEIEAANALLKRAQLARAADAAILEARLAQLGHEAFLTVAGPVLSRASVAGAQTALGALRPTLVTAAAVSPALRRLTRPSGPLARRLGLAPVERRTLMSRLNARRELPPARRPRGGGGQAFELQRIATLDAPGRPAYTVIAEDAPPQDPPGTGVDSPDAARFRQALAPLKTWIGSLIALNVAPPVQRADLPKLRAAVQDALDPEVTVARHVSARLSFAGQRPASADPLAPVMAYPRFTAPMVNELAATSTELLLPGLEKVPAESIVGLETNSPFVEAYMIGLNHEMGRELLWRAYPTDQRGTYFARFWDRSRAVPTPTAGQLDDIAVPIAEWDASDALGAHLRGGTSTSAEMVVILIRGTLLRRYPGALIYFAQAKWDSGRRVPTSTEVHPAFRGSLEPDVTFIGFDLLPADARGDPSPAANRPGWFLVFQEQPSELRFGLHDDPAATQPPAAGALAWQHLGDAAKLVYAPVKGVSSTGWPDPWGPDAARVAKACRQVPVRLAVHADDLLP
jgi:hypothetical protein